MSINMEHLDWVNGIVVMLYLIVIGFVIGGLISGVLDDGQDDDSVGYNYELRFTEEDGVKNAFIKFKAKGDGTATVHIGYGTEEICKDYPYHSGKNLIQVPVKDTELVSVEFHERS